MALTKIQPNIIAVANNVTNKTVGNTTSIPSFTFDGAGVVTSASNVAISGAGITANTVANSAFQTGSVENYLSAQGLALGQRNRVINGCMRYDQRYSGANSSTVYAGTSVFTLDRWKLEASNANKISVQQMDGANTSYTGYEANSAPTGFCNSLKVKSLTSTTVGAGDIYLIRQTIEGYNISDLNWGTANASPITLSFWVKSSVTGTFGGAFNGGQAYPFTYTIVAANTWEQKVITIIGSTTGTWDNQNGTGCQIWFQIGCGSSYTGTPGSWSSNNYLGATGGTNLVNTSGATWYLSGVQFEKGSQATPFEYRQYGTELALCQRYYELVTYAGKQYQSIGNGNCQSTTSAETIYQFKVSKRTSPTLSYANGNYYYFFSGLSTFSFSAWTQDSNYLSTEATNIFADTISGATVGRGGSFRQSNTAGFIAFSAEL